MAVMALAEAGTSVPEIAAISGHSLAGVTQILEHYLVRTKALATSAITRRLEAEGVTPVSPAPAESNRSLKPRRPHLLTF